jgi:outer membrane protein assembly factor BamD
MMKDLMERLERKSYESAKMYYTMEDYKASRYALKNVLKDNAENQYREEILYYVAMSSYKYAYNSIVEKQKERYLDFVDDYYNFISEYPESKFRKELDGLFARAEKHVGHTKVEKSEEL